MTDKMDNSERKNILVICPVINKDFLDKIVDEINTNHQESQIDLLIPETDNRPSIESIRNLFIANGPGIQQSNLSNYLINTLKEQFYDIVFLVKDRLESADDPGQSKHYEVAESIQPKTVHYIDSKLNKENTAYSIKRSDSIKKSLKNIDWIYNAKQCFDQNKKWAKKTFGIKIVPGFLRNITSKRFFCGYKNAGKFLQNEGESIFLWTVRKCGTNYFRLFVANYLEQYFGEDKTINYDKMHNEMFPNSQPYRSNSVEEKYKEPSDLVKKAGYSDFLYDHLAEYENLIGAKKVICLYRNPLDHLVSLFHDKWKNRPNRMETVNSIDDIIEEDLPTFIDIFKRLKSFCSQNPNTIKISYENMFRYPQSVFYFVLNWLDIPIDTKDLTIAIQKSSIDRVQEYEEEHGPIHVNTNEKYEGKFARSGKIGQWKDHFSEDGIRKVKNLLSKAQIDFDQFIFE